MAKYSDSATAGGPRYSGYAVIGPPFSCEKVFETLEADWAGGRVTATFTGTITKVLPQVLMSWGDEPEELYVPDKAVGEKVWMYLEHPLKNHAMGEEEGSYRWLNTSWSKHGRPFAKFWTPWVLARAGFSTKDLSVQDGEHLALEIQSALNAGGSWAAPIRDSRLRDFETPLPPGEEVIAAFYQMPYYNWRLKRPTWIEYTAITKEGRERTVREVCFLLRVVAPEQWCGVLLPLKANYTIIHAQQDEESVWGKTHTNATFDSVLKSVGISSLGAFFEDIPAERLFEKDPGEVVNILDYAETALIKAAEMSHMMHVVVPAEGWINREAVQPATNLNVQRIAGDGFVVPVLKTVKELGPITSEPEPVPGFGKEDDATSYLSTAEVVAFLNEAGARFDVPQVATSEGKFIEGDGVHWLQRFVAPLYEALGLSRQSPVDNWTAEIRSDMDLLLQDEMFVDGCKERKELVEDDAFEGLVTYAKERLETEKAVADGTDFF